MTRLEQAKQQALGLIEWGQRDGRKTLTPVQLELALEHMYRAAYRDCRSDITDTVKSTLAEHEIDYLFEQRMTHRW